MNAARLQTDDGQDELDEAMLVRRAAHEPEAFKLLYQRTMPRVYAYVRARCGGDEEAADLTQQVFVRVLAALPRYDDRGLPFGAWLFRIARNLVIDTHRRRRVTLPLDLIPEPLHPTSTWDPERYALRHEEAARIRRLLLELDEEKREALLLRFVGGLTAAEIGAVVGKSETAVQKQLERTLRHLKGRYHDA